MQNQIASFVESGSPINIAYRSMTTQMGNWPAGVTRHDVTLSRSFTRLAAIFLSFGADTVPQLGGAVPASYSTRQSLHTPVTLFRGPGENIDHVPAVDNIQFQIKVGSYQWPDQPVSSTAEAFYRLLQSIGRHWGSEGVSITPTEFRYDRFIVGCTLERAGTHPGLSLAFSGVNTRAGDLVNVVLAMPNGADLTSTYTTLVYDAVLQLTIDGCSVED